MKYQDMFKSRGLLLKELAAARLRLTELEASHEEYRGAETAMRESVAEMRAVVDALPDLVIRMHRDGTFLDVKSPSDEILSLPAEEIIGRNIRETGLPEEVAAIHLRSIEAVFRTGAVRTFEYVLEVAGGGREFEGRAVACSEHEALLIIRDVTESKRTSEDLKQLEARLYRSRKMESVGRLAAGVAHNLNNLLTPVLCYAELLLAGGMPVEQQQRRLRLIIKAASDAGELIRQLLAAGRVQTSEDRRLDLRQVVDDYRRNMRRALRVNIDLEIRHHRGPVVVEVDRSQMEHILSILVLNAQDAMAGRGRVVIDTRSVALAGDHPELQSGHYGSLRVSDNGCGIDSSVREQIFEPFFTTKDHGIGMGLAAVYGIIKQHGGDIRLESTVGEGSTFEILLPLCAEIKEIQHE